MARPIKWRRVCCAPSKNLFGPINNNNNNNNEPIIMTVDEYETIRLIDYEQKMQEECAESMDVARTTVQRIYNEARKKLADALVNGRILLIEGGNYKYHDDENYKYRCGRCRRNFNK